ncbi:MAG: sulfatase [Bacteroidota bacterium]|nr:sulfatase [Bacteroidota bacterium]
MFFGCTETRPPNIIFIMSDDHASKAISIYDSSLIRTPNIDRLGHEGMKFTNCFATNAICGPSRACILTGTYSHINGQINNNVAFDGSQLTFPKLLQEAGYQTAIIGKWHLRSEPAGFDYWNVLPGQGAYYNPDMIEMGEKKRLSGYVTDIITEKALEWLQSKDPEKPFCLMMHHKAPHRSWMPRLDLANLYDSVDFPLPDNYFDDFAGRSEAARQQKMSIADDMLMGYDLKMSEGPGSEQVINDGWLGEFKRMNEKQRQSWNEAYRKKNDAFHEAELKGEALAKWKYQRYMQDYLSTIAAVDESVGRILAYLDESGLAENTIVVYTSDQGFFLGEKGWFDKRFMYSEAFKMPMLVRYPGEIVAGSQNDELISNVDFAPTFLELAGIEAPAEMQGKSFRSMFLDEQDTDWRDAVYYHYYEYPGAHMVKRHYGIRTHRYKLIHFYHDIDEWEFYDLREDPKEMNNLYPDESYIDIIRDLKVKLAELQEQYQVPDIREELAQSIIEKEHLAVGRTIQLRTKPADRYKPGEETLIDGKMHRLSLFSSGDHSQYTGFHGNDLEALIDLEKPMDIQQIEVRCLQKESAWIFLPQKVIIQVSEDGKNYDDVTEITQSIHSSFGMDKIVGFAASGIKYPVRYIKITAINQGTCPPGHQGEGQPAWLFVDEIVISG